MEVTLLAKRHSRMATETYLGRRRALRGANGVDIHYQGSRGC